MQITVAPKSPSIHALQVAAALVILGSLCLLAGCQGVSAGNKSSNQQSSTLSLASATLEFGSVVSGASKTLSIVATNSGTASLTISAVAFSSKSFSLTAPSLPLTLNAGQSTTISIQFTPSAVATFTGTATVSSDASNGSGVISLSGTGLPDGSPGQLSVSPSALNFGSVLDGSQQTQTVTLTNTGGSNVDVSQASVTGAGFQMGGIALPLTLSPSQSTTFTVTFAPQAAGSFTGTTTLTSDGSNSNLMVSLSGTGVAQGALALNPSGLIFGSVTVGRSQSLSATLTNTGGSSVTISQIAVSGAGFTETGISTPLTLAAGESATLTVKFAPTTPGSTTGDVTITSTASNPSLVVPLSGTGTAAVGQLSVSPTTLNIGSVVVGSSGSAPGTLTATGANVTVTSATTDNLVFNFGGASLPITILAGQSVPFTVTFSPTITGTVTATLTFKSNAQPSTTTETLKGTGASAATHSVALSWNASSSLGVAGYNIYRAVYTTSCGAFSKLNGSLDANTVYTDSTVVNSKSYCYATTAVNTSNEESSYSNIISNIQIPAQ